MEISDFQASGGNVIGDIQISVTDPGGDNPVLVATGTFTDSSQTVARTIRVALQYICPIPAPENAINILGSLSTKADFKLFDHNGNIYLGGSEDDVIYLTDGQLKLKQDLTITGKGTLILDGGKMELKSVYSFNWEGDIYILGDESKGDAIFKVKKGVCNIIGDIYLLGSNNGKAKLAFHNEDTEENDSYTKIVGSILASGGSGDNSKAEMRVHHGDVVIEGMISLIGNKTKLDLHQKHKIHGKEGAWLENDDSDIEIKGGISLMVPDASKESTDQKAEIKIHAHEETLDEYWEGMIEIRYDSDIVRAATKRFAKKLGLVGRFRVVSWSAK
jgi:hypothetical protein